MVATSNCIVYRTALDGITLNAFRTAVDSVRLLPMPTSSGAKSASLFGIMPHEHWLTGVVYHFGSMANARNWQMAVASPTPVQVLDFADDAKREFRFDFDSSQHNQRKICTLIPITLGVAPQDECTLELAIESIDGNYALLSKSTLKIGDVAIFPATCAWRVIQTPQGRAKLLAGWIVGPRFA